MNKKLSKLLPILLVVLILSTIAFKDDNTTVIVTSPQDSLLVKSRNSGWIYLNKGISENIQEFFSKNKTELGFNKRLSLRSENSFLDELGMKHILFRMEVDGIPIDDAWGTAHYNENGELNHMVCKENLALPEYKKPLITEDEAIKFAENEFNKKQAVTPFEYEPSYSKDIMSELVYYKRPKEVDYDLVYKIDISSSSLKSHYTIYVNAITGDITHTFDNIFKSTGTVATVYNGSKSIKTTWRSWPYSYYYLKNTINSTPILTRNSDMRYGYSTCIPWGFSNLDRVDDSNNSWTLNSNENAASTHWAVSEAYSVFKNTFGRTYGTFTSSGNEIRVENNYFKWKYADIYNVYHICNLSTYYQPLSGEDYIHAGYIYGSTNGFAGSLDVMAHEFTHGVIYRSRSVGEASGTEAGALMESFCDIFGEVVEYYTLGSTDYCAGTNLDTTYRRSFSNPGDHPLYIPTISVSTSCEASVSSVTYESEYPVIYDDSNWDDDDEQYINLMVQNRWFYLLANGGTQNSVTVSGIGIAKAAAITYRNLLYYYTSSSTYSSIRTASIANAQTLYGLCSNEYKQVMNAWAACGVGTVAPNPCYLPLVVSISGPDYLEEDDCDTWTSSVSGGTGSYSYDWYLDDVWQSSSSSYSDCFTSAGYYEIYLSVTSGSYSDSDWIYLTVDDGGFPPPPTAPDNNIELSVYPNPSTSYMTVSLSSNNKRDTGGEEYNNCYIYITNRQGQILSKKKFNGGDLTFNTERYTEGLYSVIIVNNHKMLQSKNIVINH